MNDNAKHFIAGGISGMATVISGYPLDTIKVKMQCAAGELTMQQCIKDIIRIRFLAAAIKCTLDRTTSLHMICSIGIIKTLRSKGGILGFYRGMMSPILSATPVNAFAFSVNGHNQKFWENFEIFNTFLSHKF